ncbi:lymphocyte cytosolic protein 2a [Megalops cyprinoides]|uniref:lymphocyte cytosolic protein 2a n=1 Tax=Megalops cyprinoides TaxID=118141 RepID=UPI001864759E|nr:lymphocyte cytosolic protein 2a [Megalops cyprinoides]
MSFGNVPSKAEVMNWNPPRLADYMRKLDLSGCDKVIMKCSMNGPRFLNMSDNDLQKFPKLHAPLISKICQEINKKEEKRGFFQKKSTPYKYTEPAAVPEDVGWDSEEFDPSDDDYESPNADDDEEGSGGDYESPNEDEPNMVRGGAESDNDNDYEPPPSEPPDELPRQICPAKPMEDSQYIDNNRNRGMSVKAPNSQPPIPPQRPSPGPPLPASIRPSLAGPTPPRREQSPQRPLRSSKPSPGPPAPQVDRSKKPTTLERCLPGLPERESPLPERKSAGGGRSGTPPRRPPVVDKPRDPPLMMAKPPIPGPAVSRSASSVSRQTLTTRPFDQRNDFQDDVPKPPLPGAFNSNTFPLPSRSLPPRPGLPGAPLPGDRYVPSPSNMPPNIPSSASLPSRLQPGVNVHRSSSRGEADRILRPPPQPQRPPIPDPEPEDEQDLDPHWYVGQVTRPQAEDCLRRINQDGTFLVRDSSKRSSSQPYTLMVLYQGKVYNIQIRYHSEQDSFLLGTGFKGRENFQGVRDIIEHHMHMPLLLIDAKDRGSGQQRQCLLTHPAGY